MDESGETERIGRWRENEDRISALPDSLIHHILSCLPSTKQAIRTGILSKRWHNQWTFVSNLIFDFTHSPACAHIPLTTATMSRIVDLTLFLHRCSKIHKFQIIEDRSYDCKHDPNYEEKICFVVRKQAEELILKFSYQPEFGLRDFFSRRIEFSLPDFFFSQPSLEKLQLSGCYFNPTGMVNWGRLKDLSLELCTCSCEVIASIVSGSPLLQSLKLMYRGHSDSRLVIASKSLKILLLFVIDCDVGIFCPNLVEFDGRTFESARQNFKWSDKVLEKFLSDCPLLESLKLEHFLFSNVRIASKFLKKFVFWGRIKEIAISCPHLEELGLSGGLQTVSLMNLSSLVHASFWCETTAAKRILEGVQHLNELTLGGSFLRSLSNLEMDVISHPLLNCKSLTLDGAHGFSFEDIPGIVYALRSSPVLERLVVKFQPFELLKLKDPKDLDLSREDDWNPNGTHFSSLVSHLRTFKIIGFSQRLSNPKLVLDFVEILLKNAIVLENTVIMLEDCGTDFVTKVAKKLSSFPQCSAGVVELLCP